MKRSVLNDIKDFFFKGHNVNRIILAITFLSLVFILLRAILSGIFPNFNLGDYFFLSSDLFEILKHIWVLISHLFVSNNPYELIWWLILYYWFGSIIGDLLGDRRILPLYFFTGLLSSAILLIFVNIFNIKLYYISGVEFSVVGTMVAAMILVPDYSFHLVLFGKVRIKYIVLAVLVVDILFSYASSRYQFIGLAGSVIGGWYYILSIKSGKGIDIQINKALGYIVSLFDKNKRKSKKLRVEYKNTENDVSLKKKNTTELNRILEKINKQGIDKLDISEKNFLDEMSDK